MATRAVRDAACSECRQPIGDHSAWTMRVTVAGNVYSHTQCPAAVVLAQYRADKLRLLERQAVALESLAAHEKKP